jgi:hypothetical protein
MKKIAHFGAFDHDSYGDLLFPRILEMLLPDFDLVHVSPTGLPSRWTDACPTLSIAEAIRRTDWDGVIIGGGDIIQSGEWIDKKSLFRGTGTRPPACACPHADRLEPV